MVKKSIKEYYKYLFMLIIVLVCIIKVDCSTASAADDIAVYKSQLNLDGNWVNYNLKEHEYHYIPIKTTSSGTLLITFRTFCSANYVTILDSNLKEIDSYEYRYFPYGSLASPAFVEYKLDLEAGEYYVRYEYWNSEGKYGVKARFEKASINESEDNNSFLNAMNIGLNKKYAGFLSIQDEFDFYKFSVSKRQKYTINYMSTNGNGIFRLFDSDFKSIEERWIYDSETKTYEKVLTAGVYYISFERANGTGTYNFKISEPKKSYTISIPQKFNIKRKNKKSLVLTWKKVRGAIGYEIFRSTSKRGKFKKIKTVSNKTRYVDTKLKKRKTYYYKIRSIKKINNKKYYSYFSKIKKG